MEAAQKTILAQSNAFVGSTVFASSEDAILTSPNEDTAFHLPLGTSSIGHMQSAKKVNGARKKWGEGGDPCPQLRLCACSVLQ